MRFESPRRSRKDLPTACHRLGPRFVSDNADLGAQSFLEHRNWLFQKSLSNRRNVLWQLSTSNLSMHRLPPFRPIVE